jgi:hypothetical protein
MPEDASAALRRASLERRTLEVREKSPQGVTKSLHRARRSPTPTTGSPRYTLSPSPVASLPPTSLLVHTSFVSGDYSEVDAWVNKFVTTVNSKGYKKASTHPPISRDSLKELEAQCILNNPKLRHDINFDRELHFRPNLDGERGQSKLRAADYYWEALEIELSMYTYIRTDPSGEVFRNTPGFYQGISRYEKRVPTMFQYMKDIILSMNEKSAMLGVSDALDVPYIMQQIHRGVYNVAALGDFLERLLKAHCAPMRDGWVEKVCGLLRDGAEADTFKTVVMGFKELFGLLEAMKLDIANHQIRALRPMLLDTAIGFEQNYYKHRLETGSIATTAAQGWFDEAKEADVDTIPRHALAHFIDRFCHSLVQPKPKMPETFKLDLDRLVNLRQDIHGLVYTSICTRALAQLMQTGRRDAQHQRRAGKYINEVLPILVGRQPDANKWVSLISTIAPELVRAALGDFNGEERAAPILSSTGINPDSFIKAIEAHLNFAFIQGSQYFTRALTEQHHLFLERVTSLIMTNMHASTQELVDLFVPRPAFSYIMEAKKQKKFDAQKFLAPPPTTQEPVDEIAKRAAHMAILHWRVWADLVYVPRPSDTDMTPA